MGRSPGGHSNGRYITQWNEGLGGPGGRDDNKLGNNRVVNIATMIIEQPGGQLRARRPFERPVQHKMINNNEAGIRARKHIGWGPAEGQAWRPEGPYVEHNENIVNCQPMKAGRPFERPVKKKWVVT